MDQQSAILELDSALATHHTNRVKQDIKDLIARANNFNRLVNGHVKQYLVEDKPIPKGLQSARTDKNFMLAKYLNEVQSVDSVKSNKFEIGQGGDLVNPIMMDENSSPTGSLTSLGTPKFNNDANHHHHLFEKNDNQNYASEDIAQINDQLTNREIAQMIVNELVKFG